MVTYPVRVSRKSYRGSKETIRRKTNEHNRIARELEEYINQRIKEQEEETRVYYYYEIASETGYSKELVREILFSVDCGHHGFTDRKTTDIDNLE
jgi:hypothetical protein